MGAVLVAAAMVLAGCTTDDGVDQVSTTTNPSVTEQPGNPWDLPLEQRPPLFDPCEEIPIEAVEEGVGSDVSSVGEYSHYIANELISCGWGSHEVHLSLLSTWKSRSEFLADSAFSIENNGPSVRGRESLRMSESIDDGERTCLHLFFTDGGAIMVKLDIFNVFREFRGEGPVSACSALDEAIQPIVDYIPQEIV